ncbi:MAG: TfuA-like protein, partial [Gammaproteobacteria bacterium]
MRYDPALPLAVFLGPSLAPATAHALLPANYYPPVRMGDIYRLLASGVETIAIIDGVFHQSTPVWQREILAALEAGIRVVGGASMGALRAAELAPYGMEGIGTIFGWYRDGVLDGDDEVALVHADADLDYRALSEPLVNMRHNLARAHERGLLDTASHDALVRWAKARCFSARSWRGLREAPPWQALPAPAQSALESFLAADLEDLKQIDARAVLAHLRVPAGAPTPLPRAPWSYPGAARTRLQAALGPNGALIDGATLLAAALAGDTTWVEPCLRSARARCYLEDWLTLTGTSPPPTAIARGRTRHLPAAAQPDLAAWCRAHGLTITELEAALATRARADWIMHGEPAALGLDFAAHAALLASGDAAPPARA